MQKIDNFQIYQEVMEILPTPVLIKDSGLRYVFINKAFEELFQVDRKNIIGELDCNVFKKRQVAQCNGGDLRVLATGEVDEAYESVFNQDSEQREVITRKNRLESESGEIYLVGLIYDITDVTVMNQQLLANQTKLTYQSKQLEIMVSTDPLTGCHNRRSFDTLLPSLFESTDYYGGVLAIDIDHFKHVNDKHGHQVGDLVLKNIVSVISSIISSDQELIRMGGEEFLITLAGAKPDELTRLAERLRLAVEVSSISLPEDTLSTTISIGVSHTQTMKEWNLDQLINTADKALYQAKESGRNCIVSLCD
ncbi:hypothetical protein BCU68_08700 [Vibrio sp. 10N.286.49.B3]|uniref:sensor domain-containing diguanylate cyclase n=1 Tax=Vibrio sp. 10N.286.49.B3 TaxID=1880855 RepID=UPI000C852F90|nr:GGDEF domain-containing protein [Vibrio sp. 10N.286.49.B3]PMH46141.1 hypothetical protein BCU68_08700 [Vibrio sp. 10N.286.49.B3]